MVVDAVALGLDLQLEEAVELLELGLEPMLALAHAKDLARGRPADDW